MTEQEWNAKVGEKVCWDKVMWTDRWCAVEAVMVREDDGYSHLWQYDHWKHTFKDEIKERLDNPQ